MLKILSRSALGLFVAAGILAPTALAEGFSNYRGFRLGSDLPTVGRQIGANPPEAKLIHARPVLMQNLTWRPGLTPDDMIEAISVNYGAAAKASMPATSVEDPLDKDQLLARWEDAEHRFELTRFGYGRAYKLIGVLKRLEAPVRAAVGEASRLDAQEAPQRDAARLAAEQAATRTSLEKTRLANKAKFRPQAGKGRRI